MAALCTLALVACSSNKELPPSATPAPSASEAVTAEPPSADAGNEKIVFVDKAKVDCEGEGPQTCLRIRSAESEPWTLFYSRIEGFTFEEGHAYKLRVEVTSVANPPAGGSSERYRLLEVVSKTP